MKTRQRKQHPKGQALLIVLVISTLTLLLLMGVAARIDTGRTNVRRSSEFDRAVAASDNALNEVIKIVERATCTLAFNSTEYRQMTGCDALNKLDAQVFGKESEDKKVSTSPTNPIALFLGESTTTKVASTGVRVVCASGDSRYKFIVTRVYVDTDGAYKVDKGVTDCAAANARQSATHGNVELFGTYLNNGVLTQDYVSRPEPASSPILINREDTKLVRVRPLDVPSGVNPENSISIELLHSTGGTSRVVASTGKYDFIIVGAGGLGSDVAIKFQKQRGDYSYVPSAFDFVYFGETLQ